MKQTLILLFSCVFLCQCNSIRVTGAAPSPSITKLAIVKNDTLEMDGMQPEVVKQIQAMGIAPELVVAPPTDNAYYMTFTAYWKWDFAVYLKHFSATLHQGPAVIGSVKYKAGGLDPNKFGRTADKIRPLLRHLLRGEEL